MTCDYSTVTIAPYIFENVNKEIGGKPFSVQFFETATQYVKKQINEYISSSSILTKKYFRLLWANIYGPLRKKLNARFEENFGTHFSNFGPYIFHICEPYFFGRLKKLKNAISLDQSGSDRYFFMKFSFARRG